MKYLITENKVITIMAFTYTYVIHTCRTGMLIIILLFRKKNGKPRHITRASKYVVNHAEILFEQRLSNPFNMITLCQQNYT